MKRYKVVPGPKNIEVSGGKSSQAFQSFEDLINANTDNGWTYHSMETISVTEKGCMNSNTLNYYMLIFEKDD